MIHLERDGAHVLVHSLCLQDILFLQLVSQSAHVNNERLAIKFNKVNDLLFVGYPLLNLAGNINSYGIYGFTFFFPNYQSLIFGLANSSSQISGLIAYVLEFMVKANISLWLVHAIFGK